MSQDRILWADIFKGLAILCVVFGHCGSPFTPVIYSFHMPLFFVISGYTTRLDKYDFRDFLKRRAHSLIVPFWGTNIIHLFIWLLLGALGLSAMIIPQPVSQEAFVQHLWRILIDCKPSAEMGGASWFLLALFWASVITHIAHCITSRSEGPAWTLLLPTLFVSLTFVRYASALPYDSDLGAIGSFFFAAGVVCREYRVLERIPVIPGLILSFLLLLYFNSLYPVGLNFVGRGFPRFYEFVISTAFATSFFYIVSRGLACVPYVRRSMAFIGRNSLSILAFHFLGFKIAFAILLYFGKTDLKQLAYIVPYSKMYSWWWFIALISVLFSLSMAALLGRFKLTRTLALGQ